MVVLLLLHLFADHTETPLHSKVRMPATGGVMPEFTAGENWLTD